MKLSEKALAFDNGSNVILLTKDKVLTEQFIERLKRFGVPGVYVADGITGDILPSQPIISNKIKTDTLHNLEWVFKNVNYAKASQAKKRVEKLDKTVFEMIKILKSNSSTLINIADLKSYDDYTYNHSLSVALLSLAIGMQLRLSEDELHKLGFAAIMHDIGKMYVPIELINKTSRLTKKEFDIVKQHSEFSGSYLMDNQLKDAEIFNAVVSHHEKCDGSGYPFGLMDKDIPLYSKIISVSDVYDALTSHRPYRQPNQPSEAAEYIMGGCGSFFDINVVRAFMHRIEFFPIGAFVQLSDGQKAIVIENTAPLHPVVKLIEKPYDIIDLFNDRNYYNVVITKLYSEPPSQMLDELAASD